MPAEALADAESARDFVIREGIVTIPEPARIAHVEMVDDEMSKTYPFAAYSWRRATSDGESGRYMVSPGATWMTPEQQDERLRGNCRAWTRVVAAHETWPGHHLQFWVADHSVARIRREVTTPVFVEGWGFYCEGLLARHGYFAKPSERLARLVMRSWRASRVILDVQLHCEGMKPSAAIDFLVLHVGMPRDGATAEVRRYCDSPTQPFSYAWGCREIERLYAEEQVSAPRSTNARSTTSCSPAARSSFRSCGGCSGTERSLRLLRPRCERERHLGVAGDDLLDRALRRLAVNETLRQQLMKLAREPVRPEPSVGVGVRGDVRPVRRRHLDESVGDAAAARVDDTSADRRAGAPLHDELLAVRRDEGALRSNVECVLRR
jgi:hypothetical protein